MTKRKSVKTLELLTINGLCHILNVSKSTLKKWMDDFNVYIPKSESQHETYYHPESIDVLKFIKMCKFQNYPNPQIKEMLTNRNMPVMETQPVDDVLYSVDKGSYRENLLTIMQTLGKAVSKSERQERVLKQQHNQSLKQAEEIMKLKSEINELKLQLHPEMEYEKKKQSFKKLFETQSNNEHIT